MGGADDRTSGPTGEVPEDETIALSKDELDDILSEAEIVTEKKGSKGEPALEDSLDFDEDILSVGGDDIAGDFITVDTGTGGPAGESGDEFDISAEIDELTAEDLENIELEGVDLESYAGELDTQLGEIEEEGDEGESILTDLEAEDVSLDSEHELAEPTDIENMDLDLDSILSEGESDEIPSLDETGGLEEPPILGEDAGQVMESLSLDDTFAGETAAADEFAEIDLDSLGEGDEGGTSLDIPELEEDLGEFEGVDMSEAELEAGIESEVSEEETPGMEASFEDMSFDEIPGGEFSGEDMSLDAEGIPAGLDEVQLTEEEDSLLSEDFNLEEAEDEDVVTLTGGELDTIAGLEKESTPSAEGGEQVTLDSSLYSDIAVVLKYMDTLLGNLPEEKIKEFSQSRYFPLYKEVFEKLDLT